MDLFRFFFPLKWFYRQFAKAETELCLETTADSFVKHRKLTLYLRPWEIVSWKGISFGELCTKNSELWANCEHWALFWNEHFYYFNLLSLQIFFGFTFMQNYHFQSENLFFRQINRSRALFSFPSCDKLCFFQSWRVVYKKTRAQVPTESSVERLEFFVNLRYLWTLFAKKRCLFAAKMYFISQGVKKTAY